ncbi:MAG: LysR family transcriptional regulator [Proteobacteria bacterium]|nr:LysR family transcriptional regulator [Pseudomonadota bacterium]
MIVKRPTPETALPNLRHLRLFLEVMRRGSVSAAARAAHVTQPAATQALAAVEASLGMALMERQTGSLRPVVAAEAAALRIDRALNILAEAVDSVTAGGSVSDRWDPLRGITITQLSALIGVTRYGGFARAAQMAKLGRASIHRAVRQLERTLGIPLFERTSFGVRPTREAGKLALHAQLAFSELAQVRAELAAASGAGSGSTVIGAMPLARSQLIPRAVLELTGRHPGHSVSILDGPYETLLAALRCGTADILVGALRDPSPGDDVIQEHVFDDPLAIVMRTGHPLARNRSLSPVDLAAFPWIAPRAESPLHRHFERLLHGIGRTQAAPIECGSLVAARGILLASDRLILLSAHQVQNDVTTGQLVALPHPRGPVARAIGITRRRGWHPTGEQLLLLETIRRHGRELRQSHGP